MTFMSAVRVLRAAKIERLRLGEAFPMQGVVLRSAKNCHMAGVVLATIQSEHVIVCAVRDIVSPPGVPIVLGLVYDLAPTVVDLQPVAREFPVLDHEQIIGTIALRREHVRDDHILRLDRVAVCV